MLKQQFLKAYPPPLFVFKKKKPFFIDCENFTPPPTLNTGPPLGINNEQSLIPFPLPFERLPRRLLYPQCAFQTEIRGVCAKTFFTTASAIISYFARKGELLFTNSDQIADRLCGLSKKEQKSVHYMNI